MKDKWRRNKQKFYLNRAYSICLFTGWKETVKNNYSQLCCILKVTRTHEIFPPLHALLSHWQADASSLFLKTATLSLSAEKLRPAEQSKASYLYIPKQCRKIVGASPKSKMIQDVFFHFLQVRVAEMNKILSAKTAALWNIQNIYKPLHRTHNNSSKSSSQKLGNATGTNAYTTLFCFLVHCIKEILNVIAALHLMKYHIWHFTFHSLHRMKLLKKSPDVRTHLQQCNLYLKRH